MNIILAIVDIIFAAIIVLLVIRTIIFFFKNLISIFKNLRLFKYFFKSPLNEKDWFQIVSIFILIILFIGEFYFFANINNFTCRGSIPNEFRSACKKEVSALNQCMEITYAIGEEVQLSSADDFAKMMKTRFNSLLGSNREELLSKTGSKNKLFTNNEIKKYNLEKYNETPILQALDGTIFMFEKFQNNCQYVDENTPENSDCIMVFDTNGFLPPNEITTDKKIPKDRYYVVIYGKENKAVILDKEQQHIMYDKPY